MIKKPPLSPEQDYAANPTENIWVQANAGTGKTSVLIQRLLRILFRTDDSGANGILCLTYTNAGAGEMRNRILSALRDWAMASDKELQELLKDVAFNKPATTDDIIHAREIFFTYIDNPEILKIKTIHGFCEEILHRFPIEAGISPSWSLISGAPQKVLLQNTFDKMINSPDKNDKILPAFTHIVERISETSLGDLLDILSKQYKIFFQINDIDKYREYFIETTKKLLNIQNEPNTDFNPEKLQKIIEIATEVQNNRKKPAKYLDKIITLTKQYIEKTINFEKYKKAYLTNSDTPIDDVSKQDFLIEEQNWVYTINQHKINTQILQDNIAIFDLSAAFAHEYKQLKQQNNLLDFEDLILYTKKLFSDSATMGWILSQLDISLSHILVDEAQDTSPLQWDILRMLSGDFFTDGNTDKNTRSIFVVGDTKQSIYGFQGADPQAFANSRDEIGKQIEQNMRTIHEIPLTQSFRSTAPILNTVDKFFDNPEVISISNFKNNSHKCFRTDAKGVVEIHKLISKQLDDIDTKSYISQISAKIKSVIDQGKYCAGDIMVLVQQRPPLAPLLVTELKKHNIDVAGSDRIVLPKFTAIQDMLNLVRWCLNPSDDYSLCCALKSPLFFMKEQDIFNICQIKNTINKEHVKTDINSKQITVFEILESEYTEIYNKLSDIKNHADNLGPYSFFSHILNHHNARKNFISALGNQVIDPIEEFMTICLSYERTQPGTLYHFLKWFITGNSEIKRDMDKSQGVRIVTIHSSKGLEAPVIFLIDTTKIPEPEKIIHITQDDYPIWLWAPRTPNSVIYQKLQSDILNTQISEYYRLLYVAMTRARDELYIYGHTAYTKANQIAWHTQLWQTLSSDDTSDIIRITNDDIK